MGNEDLSHHELPGHGALGSATERFRPRAAAAAANDRTVRFSDDFTRPDSTTVGHGWNALRGTWAIASDGLELTAGTAQLLIAQTALELGPTFVVEATVRLREPGGSHNGIAFNIHDGGAGQRSWYAATLQLGTPSIWSVWEIGTDLVTRLPAYDEIDISAGHDYTIRVRASEYGRFEVQIRDGGTVLADKRVQLDPFAQQLAGGCVGAYSQNGGRFRVSRLSVASSSAPADPPAPPAPAPLVCTPARGPAYRIPGPMWTVAESHQIDRTNAKLAVGQPLLTHSGIQYVGYFDADQQMVIAARAVGSDTWTKQPLAEHIGWDAHNSISMAVDRAGQLHVAGDMHNVPLIYFRTTTAGDVTTLRKISSMTEPATETAETYPVFSYNRDGALVYSYRNGGSGNGSSYCNIYAESTQSWRRLLDRPLFDGQGLYNSYPSISALGPDGNFHMVWVWRETADAATNSHVCYARSTDLVNWTTLDGQPLTLPIVYSTHGVLVDPIPNYGGLGAPAIGFDADNGVLISYHKLDRELNTQVYLARPGQGNDWAITQVSRWTGRYLPQGIGGIPGGPVISAVSTLPDGHLQMQYEYGDQSGVWIMNPTTLLPFTEAPVPASLPAEITALRSTFPGMGVQVRSEPEWSGSADQTYVLRWEALPTNNDLPRDPPYPDPGPLQLYLLRSS